MAFYSYRYSSTFGLGILKKLFAWVTGRYEADKDKTEVFASVCPDLLRGLLSVRTCIIEQMLLEKHRLKELEGVLQKEKPPEGGFPLGRRFTGIDSDGT